MYKVICNVNFWIEYVYIKKKKKKKKKFKNGTFLTKNEFSRSRNYTLRFFRENNDKISYFLPPSNTENS